MGHSYAIAYGLISAKTSRRSRDEIVRIQLPCSSAAFFSKFLLKSVLNYLPMNIHAQSVDASTQYFYRPATHAPPLVHRARVKFADEAFSLKDVDTVQ